MRAGRVNGHPRALGSPVMDRATGQITGDITLLGIYKVDESSLGEDHLGVPYGVVSLLDVLRFSGAGFYGLSSILSGLDKRNEAGATPDDKATLSARDIDVIRRLVLDKVTPTLAAMGLTSATAQIARIEHRLNVLQDITWLEFSAMVRSLTERIEDELTSERLFHVSKDRIRYLEYGHRPKDPLVESFPSSFTEMCAAGRCVAYGEGTAAVFHLLRAIDHGLRSVAHSLNIVYDASNWSGIGKKIQTAMEVKYQDKTDAWKASESLYASVLTDIQAISRAHRNPVFHQLETKYTEAEAEMLFTITEGFLLHLSSSGIKEIP